MRIKLRRNDIFDNDKNHLKTNLQDAEGRTKSTAKRSCKEC
jgi:hypothetical protein